MIATLTLALGGVGLRCWIIPVFLAEPSLEAPTVNIIAAELERDAREVVQPVARVSVATPPVAPRVLAPIPIPAVEPELVQAPPIPPKVEPYDPTEDLEAAEEPFPTKPEPEKKVVKSNPKPTPKTTKRPTSKPKSIPKAVAKGPSHPARVLRKVDPSYPRSARRSGTEGSVMLSVQVKTNGRVGSVRVFKTSGSRVLDSAAIAAVKRWSFAPERKNGQAVSSTLHVPFRFGLE